MPQHLSDLGQRRALAEHLRGGGVPEPMGAGWRQPGAPACLSDDLPNRAAGEASQWSSDRQEEPSTGRLRPAAAQVGHDRFPNIAGKRQAILPPSLSSHNDLTLCPIEVVKLQSRHLPCTKTEPHQQEQDGEVPSAAVGPTVAALKQLLHLLGRQSLWQRCLVPAGYRRYSADEICR